jgi:hypothetical protein
MIPAAAATLALALASGGCGSSGVTLDPVAQAADATSQAGGAHVALVAKVSATGLSSPFTMSGEGFFNYTTREGMLTLELSGLPALGAASLAGGLHIQEMFKASTIYVGSSLFAGKLPGGARWIKLDVARVGQSLGFDFRQLSGGQSNPAEFLDYLKASAGAVTPVGHDLVRGVASTHYRATIDLRKVAGALPQASRAELQAALAKVIARSGVSSLPVDVWVDTHGLVRRIALTLSQPVGGQQLQFQVTIDLFGFGATPAVTPPRDGEVLDGTQAALAALGGSGG